MSKLIVFTDGSCRSNGKRGAKAAYAACWPDHPDKDSAFLLEGQVQTNNRAEFMGVIHAFAIADTIDPSRTKTLSIYTDCMLLIRSLNEWLPGWKRRGWRKSDGQPVVNADLLQRLDHCMSLRPCELHHVPAHTGKTDWQSVWNAKVDKMATELTA